MKLFKFLGEVRAEYKNISWPDKNTIYHLSVVIIAFSVITASILGGFDFLFTKAFAELGKLKTGTNQPQIEIISPAPESSPSASPPSPAASPTK